MKRLVIMLAVISLILSVTLAFAEDENTFAPATPAKSHAMHCAKQDCKAMQDMMMQCPMMKQQQDIKAILKQILNLQQRSLNATAKEKAQIKQEIGELIKKIDAMPDKMDCPMMNMKHDASADQKTPSGNQIREEAQPSEHKH